MWFAVFLTFSGVLGCLIFGIWRRKFWISRRPSLLFKKNQSDKVEIYIDASLTTKNSGSKTEKEYGIELNSHVDLANIVILYLMAPEEHDYNGYELLQALLASGLRYGEKGIFHRHEMKTGRGHVLFSLASVNKPGTFELSKMGSFSCPGLVLFLLLKRVLDPMMAFDSMLETARQLSEDLGGEVWDQDRKLLNMDKVAQIRIRIRRFEESRRTQDFFGELDIK